MFVAVCVAMCVCVSVSVCSSKLLCSCHLHVSSLSSYQHLGLALVVMLERILVCRRHSISFVLSSLFFLVSAITLVCILLTHVSFHLSEKNTILLPPQQWADPMQR